MRGSSRVRGGSGGGEAAGVGSFRGGREDDEGAALQPSAAGHSAEGSTVEGPETGMAGYTGRAECRPVWPSGVGEMEVGAGAEEEGGVQARGFILNVTDSLWQI